MDLREAFFLLNHLIIYHFFRFSFSTIWFGLIESILLSFHFRCVANTTVLRWPWYTFMLPLKITKKNFFFCSSKEICLRSLIISLFSPPSSYSSFSCVLHYDAHHHHQSHHIINIDNRCLLLLLALTYHVSCNMLLLFLKVKYYSSFIDWLKFDMNFQRFKTLCLYLPLTFKKWNQSNEKNFFLNSNEWTYLFIYEQRLSHTERRDKIIAIMLYDMRIVTCSAHTMNAYINMSLRNSNEFFDENALPCAYWITFRRLV